MELNFIMGLEALESYKRLSYKVWYALAEFVDNATQSYYDNKSLLDAQYEKEKNLLTVNIAYNNASGNEYVSIEDNSIGMNLSELQDALTVGKPPKNTKGRSKYGLGLKTAAFWFGDSWQVTTKKLGEDHEYSFEVNLNDLVDSLKNQANSVPQAVKKLVIKPTQKPKAEHYTRIIIKRLNQKIHPRTSGKVKRYLKSIYRRDLEKQNLILSFQGEQLTWKKDELHDKILKDEKGRIYHQEFTIDVKGKLVKGWAAILSKGSRGQAGFSILQADRVIIGWPDSYRPESLFGEQEGGVNNLVNQRLFGELELDGFIVSHTKDEIIFVDDEEEILNDRLGEILMYYKRKAEEYRIPDDESEEEFDFTSIVTDIFTKLNDPRFTSVLNNKITLPPEIIKQSNEEFYNRTLETKLPTVFEALIGGIKIIVVINNHSSVYDPYLVTKSTVSINEVGVVISKNHPHWRDLKSTESVINFIKHCIYDGLAEWKANFHAGALDPDTVKMMKDSFLRQVLILFEGN